MKISTRVPQMLTFNRREEWFYGILYFLQRRRRPQGQATMPAKPK